METTFDELINYIKELGAADLEHSDVTFLGHLVGVYRNLKTWDCDEDVCRAGVFHSIYGTESFQRFKLPLERRGEVRDLIGDRAERLAYLNCAINYKVFEESLKADTTLIRMLDRFSGEQVGLSTDDFRDLSLIHLCDRIEQVPRSKDWDFRPETFAMLADRLGGFPKSEYERVYAEVIPA